MKKIIYLSILTAVIVLSGCKGNSYLNRRYTHYSNHHKHVSVKDPVAIKTNKKAPVTAVSYVTEENVKTVSNAEVSTQPLASNMKADQKVQKTNASYKFRALPAKNDNSVTKTNGLKRSVGTAFQKAKSESKHAVKGVIGDLLGLIIWIIMVVVLVTAIIILVAIL